MHEEAWATEEGTSEYRRRPVGKVADNHFHNEQGFWLSSICIGIYMGGHDDDTDTLHRQAVVRAVELGGNVIDRASTTAFKEASVPSALP